MLIQCGGPNPAESFSVSFMPRLSQPHTRNICVITRLVLHCAVPPNWDVVCGRALPNARASILGVLVFWGSHDLAELPKPKCTPTDS